jgi:glycosyltransferase involved in cell wall biosynthesis
MILWMIIYGVIISCFWISLAIYLSINRKKVRYLSGILKSTLESQPSVVIVIAVRNEESSIETALRSVCSLTYSNYYVLVVNDRSTDKTATILKKMRSEFSSLQVMEIEELPKDWLGKNHALYKGYLSSTSEWLLFTDADVNFKADTLAKAVHYCISESLDHLTVLPQVESRSSLLNAVLGTFIMMLEVRQRPWKVRDSNSNASLGVGAFNLVKRSAYIKAGTHLAIALRPDDDLKLAQKIKESVAKSDVLYGEQQIWLEWYPSIKQFINGLMKNTFSIFNYRLVILLAGGVLPVFVFYVMPVTLIFFNDYTRFLLALTMASQYAIFYSNRGVKSEWWHSFTVPVAGILMIYIMLRSAIMTLHNQGIFWRDSFYSLKDLKKGG